MAINIAIKKLIKKQTEPCKGDYSNEEAEKQ